MPLAAVQKAEIEQLLKEQIRRKLCEYSPETNNMPFHIRLLGKDRMALFSFIQSINTTLGTSVFEQVAAIIAKPNFQTAINQYKGLNNSISINSRLVIQQIIDELQSAQAKPNKIKEIEKIISVAQSGEIKNVKRATIDLFLIGNDGTEYYFDLKTAKPNIGDIVKLKRNILEWVGFSGTVNPNAKIYTGLAIPYNPYEPKPYSRWTFQGMFDLENELMIAEEFWTFLGGEQTYEQLLMVFEKVGIELRPEIDEKFATFSPKG